jgi:predicted RNA binding protein YcfA (HicA-like mRNA interferase family)
MLHHMADMLYYGLVVALIEPSRPDERQLECAWVVHRRRVLIKALSGSRNIAFGDMIALVEGFGFRLSRVSGSHHIFVHSQITELVNLQEVDGKAKPYQIRQFLKLVEQYHLELEDD